MLRWRPFCVLIFLIITSAIHGQSQVPTGYAKVQVEPVSTSIYVGNVTLTMPTLVRRESTYVATYSAKVFPYFFYNEKGSLAITLSDDELRQLERNEVVNFTGQAKNADGEVRRIEGRAVPADARSGKIKVRVFVSKKIELIFNTTYRFMEK